MDETPWFSWKLCLLDAEHSVRYSVLLIFTTIKEMQEMETTSVFSQKCLCSCDTHF